jgi:peptide/nickel transport system permease protein
VDTQLEDGGGEGLLRLAWWRFRRDRLAMLGLVLIAFMALQALLAPAILEALFGLDPYRQALVQRYRPPSLQHPLGTDELGRDGLARLLLGGRVSIAFGVLAGGIAMLVGVLVGLVSGYFGGVLDDATNVLIGTLQTIPTLFLLILLSVTFRPPFLLLAVIFGLTGWTGVARQVRGVTLAQRERQYVEAARALGVPEWQLLLRHLLPNVASVVLVLAGFAVAGAILGEAGLSYLGFGVQVPTPSWGNLLQRSLDNVTRAPWLIAGPGVMIFLTVLALFLVADGLRDALDPRIEG